MRNVWNLKALFLCRLIIDWYTSITTILHTYALIDFIKQKKPVNQTSLRNLRNMFKNVYINKILM